MNDHPHSPFLEAIRENPDDDAPRLIFADWLEDEGNLARAEFIRVQCRLACINRDDDPDEWFALQARESQLLRRQGREWAGDISRAANAWVFRRGFIEAVRMSASKYFEDLSTTWRESPIRDVRLTEFPFGLAVPEFMRRLADNPRTSRLTALDLQNSHQPSLLRIAEALSRFTPSPHLKELRLSGSLNGQGEAILKSLTEGPGLRNVRSLVLTQADQSVSPILTERAARLLESGFPHLRALGLRSWEITAAGGTAL